MRYFQKFPSVSYNTTEIFDGVSRRVNRVVPNMTVTLKISQLANELLPHEWHRIRERDRPDTLAAQWYGSSEYAWVILLSNNMRDWYDWPLTAPDFYNYMNRKYESSEGAADGVIRSQSEVDGIYQRIWKTPGGQRLVVDATAYALLPAVEKEIVTQYDKESEDNDRRRDVKRLTLDAFSEVVTEFTRLMKQV